MKKALLIGSSGMVGAALTKQLLASNAFSEVVCFVRRKSDIVHPKLTEHVIDFEQPATWHSLLQGDVLFSSLGTTIRNAKTKANQYKVDFTYQFEAAKAAAEQNVPTYVLVSSAGASAQASSFYMKMKGELDEAVQKLPFESIQILKPAQLDGNRKQKRLTEKIGLKVMYAINKLGLLKKFRPIHADIVAQAMIHASEKGKSAVYQFDELFTLADNV